MRLKNSFNKREKAVLFKPCRLYSYVPKNMELWLEEKAAEQNCSTSSLIYSALLYIQDANVDLQVKKMIRERDAEKRSRFLEKKNARAI